MLTALMATAISCVAALAQLGDAAVDRHMKNLRSSQPAVWREAALQLAHIGAPALVALEEAAEGADETLKPRLIEVVGVMIVHTVEPKEVRKSERLWALSAPGFEKGLVVARKLAKIQGYSNGDGPLLRRGVRPERDPEGPSELVSELSAMGPAGVVGAAELMEKPSATSKMYGIAVLLRIGATSFSGRLTRLCKSTTQVTIDGGCYVEATTLGEHVTKELGTRGAFAGDQAAFIELETYISSSNLDPLQKRRASDLLRRSVWITSARSWDEAWERFRSVFQQVVTLPPPSASR